jgi:hypothetical protein
MNRKISILVLLALAAALIAAGCGNGDGDGDGDSTSSTGGGESPEKQALIAQADRICAQGDAKIDKGGQKFAGTTGNKVDELVNTVIAPGYRDQIEQLRELTPPEDDQAVYDEFLSTFEQGVDQLEANPEELGGGPALGRIIEARDIAADFGMQACARGAPSS